MPEPKTFQQIGDELGISKQRAQQIYAKAIEKLKRLPPEWFGQVRRPNAIQ